MSDSGDPFSIDNPYDYPERPEVARARARRIAELAAECGQVARRAPFDEPGVEATSGEDARALPASMEEVLVRDDLDAALRYFAAAREEEPEPAPVARPGETLDFSRYRARKIRTRLLALLEDLLAAVERRDLPGVWDVLDESEACRCFPPAVREEALVIARLPATSFRAPMRLYRYYHLLRQLGDEPEPAQADPQQLDMPLDSGAIAREAETTSRNGSDRPGGRGPHHDGAGHRRSGSR